MARTPKQGRLHRTFLCAACIAGVAMYACFAVNAYRAQRFADRLDQHSIKKAVALAPRDAEYHDLLCRSRIFISQESEGAIDECRKASQLNPYSSSIWLDLAQAYASSGNNQSMDVAIHKALAVDPTTPDTAWNAANFLLADDNNTEALKQFAIVLREDPDLAPSALNICWQSLHDLHRIQSILPPNPGIYLAFVKILLSMKEGDPAHQIWSALMQSKMNLDYHQGLFYVDSLLQARDIDGASDAWKQLSLRSRALQSYSQSGSLVTDGSFTQEILNAGFDWRYNPGPTVEVTLDNAELHDGHRSLRLGYRDGGGEAGIFQYIAVQPGRRYRLSAWVKSEDLETANGPALTVSDAYDGKPWGSAEETAGTTGWHSVQTELQTGAETRLLILAIQRRPSETRIQGKFWIDDIRLEPL